MRLHTLGGLKLEGSSFQRTKPLVLLCYLAIEGAKDRRHVSELFWPGGANPLGTLSTTLGQLRQGAPGSFGADGLRVWTELKTDAKGFLDAVEKGELEEALGHYRGRFLDGVYLHDWSTELEEWVYRTREFLAGRMRATLLRIAEAEASRGHFEPAAKRAEQAYLLSGAPEPEPEELERFYTLMLAGEGPHAAEARKEAEIFGVEIKLSPSEAREQLAGAVSAMHLAPHNHNLPGRGTSFVGRDLELTEVTNLLTAPDCRLLTLTGPGGVGKTRLALQVASVLREQGHFGDGIYFVALESLTAPSLIAPALAGVLGVRLQGHNEPLSQIRALIGDKHFMLVLDNYEQLIEGATIASDLVQGCPNLKLLITSRERLNLEEEWNFPVEGLAYPDRTLTTPEEGQYFDAVQLFMQRAKRTRINFDLDKADRPSVLKICRLVEGLPLGIELAAALVKVMHPSDIAQEIERSLDLFSASTRNIPERHKSIRATFEHSWRLLSTKEQEVLQKLSVFRGGFRREAATEVANASIPILAALVDKSLLRLSQHGRFDRHPLLHLYAQGKLSEHLEEQRLAQERHASYYLALAEQAELHFKDPDQVLWMERLEEEHDNFRAALEWAEVQKQAELSMRLSSAFWPFWLMSGYLDEGREHLQRALSQPGAAEHAGVRAKTLNGIGVIARDQGDYTSACSFLEESLVIQRALGDTAGLADSLYRYGTIALAQTDYSSARSLFEESLIKQREKGSKWGVGACVLNLGLIAFDQADYTAAQPLFGECLTIMREVGDMGGVAYTLQSLSAVALNQGDYASARSLLEEGLAIMWKVGDKRGIVYSLETFAALNLLVGEIKRAVHLWGAAEAIREATGAPLLLNERRRYDREVSAARAQFDEGTFAAAWAEGRTLTVEQAVTYALDATSEQQYNLNRR